MPYDDTWTLNHKTAKSSTLLDHLLWQLELTHFSERDRAIAITLIDSINEDGYLRDSPDDIFQGLQNQLDDLDFDEVIAVLHRIQSFDPARCRCGKFKRLLALCNYNNCRTIHLTKPKHWQL